MHVGGIKALNEQEAGMSAKNKAYFEIRKKILDLEYKPGTWINEDDLCASLQLSRTPIRDALGRLEQDGLIIIYPKRGSYVTEFSLDMLLSIYETRLLIEPYILQTYAIRLEESRLLLFYNRFVDFQKRMNDASFERSMILYDTDDDFHRQIVAASNNPFLIKTYANIQSQMCRIRVLAKQNSHGRMSSSHDEHIEIILCCLKHDWNGAAEKMRSHLQRGKNSALDLFMREGNMFKD